MKHIIIVLCALLCSCQMIQRPTKAKIRAIPTDPLQKSIYYIENNEAEKALQELEPLLVNNENPEIYYLTARSYAAIAELDNAIIYYQKCLQLQSDYHPAYNLLKEIHRYRQITLQRQIDNLKEQQVTFSSSGRGDINAVMRELNQSYNRQTQIYLAQGTAFLLYNNPPSNIADFAELEAQLRDVQDFIRERKQGYVSSLKKQSFTDPLYLKVLNMRSDVTKKHIQNLVTQSRLELEQNNIANAIDLLREANTQTSRFYEDKDSNIQSLVKDDQIESLSRDIAKQLINTYNKSIDVYVANRSKYEALQQWQDIADQNRKIEENMENLIQTQVVQLMRFEKVSPEKVQRHPSLIPLYQKLLKALPDSDKKGEYHLQLAKCFAEQKNYEIALKHAAIAKKDLGSYRVDDLIEKLVEQIKRSGK
ncbi:tetratricopeptide repeat protein [Candidatus Uabimicrobium sp. HlEnr_7]|uniref:tetratricopeptide repeat protein n=1 Tax=Candidatus Uabimicrobium helgolandensis TaxID=3095367 RepID=UPI0035578870